MIQSTLSEIVNIITENQFKLIEEFNIKLIYIFGSYATGKNTPDSDLDIANIIISSLNIEKPDTYRDTILTLSKISILPQSFAKNIANMVSFRNILVHDYMSVDENIMLDILKNHLDDFINYMKYISKWIDNEY